MDIFEKESVLIKQFRYNPIKFTPKPIKSLNVTTVYPDNYKKWEDWTDKYPLP